MRLDEGPAPRRLVPVRESLIESGRAKIERVEMPPPFKAQERLVALDEPKSGLFSDEDLQIVEEQVKRFWEWGGKEISVFSHQFPAWDIAGDKESIPICAVLLKGFNPSDDARTRGMKVAEELGMEFDC
jgi:hypothetical protein